MRSVMSHFFCRGRACARPSLLVLNVGLIWFVFLLSSPAREIDVTILHTTDLHGHLDPVAVEDTREKAGQPASFDRIAAGGLLRCATLINRVRAEETNVVLVDCGDLIQGTAVSYLTRGEVMLQAVKYLHYDALVVGNHEFDWGIERFQALYRPAGIPVLAANITEAESSAHPWIQPFILKEIEGVKVIIVGLTPPLIPNWSRPRLLGGLRFIESVIALRGVMAEVRSRKPDILILAVHQGWRQWGDDRANEVNRIARAFPDFDLIIGAHTHQAIEGAEVNRIIYTQAGQYGVWLGEVRLTFDDQKRRLTRIKPRLIAISADVPPDEKLARLVAEPLRQARIYLGGKVGESARELSATQKTPGQSEVQTLIAASIAGAAGAAVVLHGALTAAGLPAGVLRMADVWRIVPYENTIGKARLTSAELREILEENSRYYGKSQFRGVYGLTYDLDKKAKEGERVSNLRWNNNREISANEKFSFAVNSYDLASAGGRFPRLREIMERPGAELVETDLDTRAAVLDYLKKHSPLEIQAAPGAVVRKQKSEVRGQRSE